MNRYVKEFLHRGLMFSGFGPIVLGIVYMIISEYEAGFSLSASEVLIAVLSTYFIAFVQAGTTVFYNIEHWSTPKSLLCHFGLLYAVYSISYIVNSWIPFDGRVLIVFSGIFVLIYFTVWIIVYLSVKNATKRMNRKIR